MNQPGFQGSLNGTHLGNEDGTQGGQGPSTDLEDALVKASSLLTKEGKRKGLEQQQEFQNLLQQLKAVSSKEHLPLTKLKDLLVEVSKCHKASKDTIKELKHLTNRAPSRAPSKAPSTRSKQ